MTMKTDCKSTFVYHSKQTKLHSTALRVEFDKLCFNWGIHIHIKVNKNNCLYTKDEMIPHLQT